MRQPRKRLNQDIDLLARGELTEIHHNWLCIEVELTSEGSPSDVPLLGYINRIRKVSNGVVGQPQLTQLMALGVGDGQHSGRALENTSSPDPVEHGLGYLSTFDVWSGA